MLVAGRPGPKDGFRFTQPILDTTAHGFHGPIRATLVVVGWVERERNPSAGHDPEKTCPGLDPGWTPVFRKDHGHRAPQSWLKSMGFLSLNPGTLSGACR